MKKIIFLDFDGVMDTAYYDSYLVANNLPETDDYGVVFDPQCIKALEHIINETDAKIVVSSTWKDFMSFKSLLDMWHDRHMPGELIDATPNVSRHRGDEIDAWLKEYGRPCKYVILDDMDFSQFNAHHQPHFLMVNPYHGLDDVTADNAINILNKEEQMTRKNNYILIVPDVHGRKFWRDAMSYVDDFEQIVFLGDYLDPYWEERIFIEDAFVEFLDILDFKRDHPDKVTLLLGNHDLHYLWSHDMNCSRRDEDHLDFLNTMFVHFRHLFQLAYEYDSGDRKYLFTHAGVLKDWLKYNGVTFSTQWLNEKLDNVSFGILGQVSDARGGMDPHGSPIWADLEEHKVAVPLEGYYQIFGHSLEQEPTITENWACLDCRRMFVLNIDTGEIVS